MAEYIERENLFKFFTGQMTRKQNGAFSKGFNKGIMVARAAVHNKEITPTADVVEVVRCKDCKYFDIEEGDALGTCMGKFACISLGGELYPEPDYFCSYGERRSE